MNQANLEGQLRTSITALVAALRRENNNAIITAKNTFINAGKAYVKAVKAANAAAGVAATPGAAKTNATPVAAAAPGAVKTNATPVAANVVLTRGFGSTKVAAAIPPAIIAVNKLTTASGGTSIKDAVLSALRGIRLLLPKARPATSTPVNNTRITNLIGNRWGEKSDLLKKYIAESYLLKNGKSNMKDQTANRDIGKKSLLGRYNDPKLREFWGMVDAKMKANAATKARTNIMGANKFNNITNRNAAITAYIKDRPANKKAANRKALAGRFGFRTVDPNLVKFFAAVNAKTAETKAAAAAVAKETRDAAAKAAQEAKAAKAAQEAAVKAERETEAKAKAKANAQAAQLAANAQKAANAKAAANALAAKAAANALAAQAAQAPTP